MTRRNSAALTGAALFFAALFLPALAQPPAAAAQEYPRDRDGQSWYHLLVLEGKLIQSPLFLADGGILAVSDDRRVQRLNGDGSPRWSALLPRRISAEVRVTQSGYAAVPLSDGSGVLLSLRDDG